MVPYVNSPFAREVYIYCCEMPRISTNDIPVIRLAGRGRVQPHSHSTSIAALLLVTMKLLFRHDLSERSNTGVHSLVYYNGRFRLLSG